MNWQVGTSVLTFLAVLSLAGSALAQETTTSSMVKYDAEASDWWRTAEGTKALGALKQNVADKKGRKAKHILVHLPSGVPASPYPSDITESERSQVVMIVPRAETVTVSLAVKQCAVPQTFRTKFDVEDAPDPGLEGAAPPPPEGFQLRAVGPALRCGPETLEYDIVTQSASDQEGAESKTTQRLRVNPRYHIAGIAALGWDSGKNNEYFLTTSDTGDDMIEWRSATQGFIAYVGAQWMIAGVDYHNMNWWNYFANLWVAVNPAAPLKDLAFGLAITPTGGIGLAVGITFHQRTRLDQGYMVGDVLTEGAIPTSTAWDGMRPGAFIGLSIDTNIYRAIKSKVN